MSKYMKEVKQKSQAELSKAIDEMRTEINKLMVTQKINQTKDTNAIGKKKKQLAVLLTARKQK